MRSKKRKQDIQYFIALGFDPATAEYFAAGRRTVELVEPVPDHQLVLTFDNGEIRLYDVKPYLRTFTVFESLRDPELFSKVYVDDQHRISWDIAPEIACTTIPRKKIEISSDVCYINSTQLLLNRHL